MDCQLQTWIIETDNDEECITQFKNVCKLDKVIIAKKKEYIKPADNCSNVPGIFYTTATGTWILNVNKAKFSYIEKCIYDIAMFHLKKMNITYNKKKHAIQFWFKNKSSCAARPLHVDFYTDYDKKTEDNAFLSTVTYFDEDVTPTIFTDASEEISNKGDFLDLHKVCFSFPKKMKHASFLGKQYFHGHWEIFQRIISNSDRDMLVLKIWDELQPDFIDYFDNELYSFPEEYNLENRAILKFNPDNKFKYIYLKDDTLINPLFFKCLIGTEIDTKICYPFGDLILKNDYNKYDTFIFEVNPDKYIEPVVNYKNYYLYTILIILLIGFIYYLYKIPDLIMFLYNSIVTRNNEDISISPLIPL